jgi:predicted metal-binding protein
MTSAILMMQDTVLATREVTLFVCVNGHRLKTTKGSDTDNRIQLYARGHKHGEFALPSRECVTCCSKPRQLVSYLLILAFGPQDQRAHVASSPNAHLVRVRKAA